MGATVSGAGEPVTSAPASHWSSAAEVGIAHMTGRVFRIYAGVLVLNQGVIVSVHVDSGPDRGNRNRSGVARRSTVLDDNDCQAGLNVGGHLGVDLARVDVEQGSVLAAHGHTGCQQRVGKRQGVGLQLARRQVLSKQREDGRRTARPRPEAGAVHHGLAGIDERSVPGTGKNQVRARSHEVKIVGVSHDAEREDIGNHVCGVVQSGGALAIGSQRILPVRGNRRGCRAVGHAPIGAEISHAVKLEKTRRVSDSGDVGAPQDKSVAVERERPDSVLVIKELGETVPVPVTTLAPLLPVIVKVFHCA